MSSEECVELKNINYQTMLLNSNTQIDSNKKNSENLNDFLEKEKILNKKKPWNKLCKGNKIQKLNDYINSYCKENKISDIKKEILREYLHKCLDRKKLQRVKDINYNKETGEIISIPGLTFQKNKFTIKRADKKNTTLKGLAPKIKRKKKKIKVKNELN